ncbi:MAG: gyrase subunit [Candidatus Methanomethylophilaceae archaeon]|nr:gyrase subunit [Candidatus Methanomethylophilaceae archaeon]MDI3541274.1 gyrase subunit [Candidatus Methanomethylophilaceae archaeon]
MSEERVINQSIENEMKRSYIDYAMSVIVGRALPDVRDGLKPVHRKILYAMYDMGLYHNRPHKKSARVVGEVLGKYHPHGDQAAYSSLVRMAQDFSMRYPLVDGQGNFGSVDGDSAAAMRYTECRMSRLATEMLADIDKDTVDFVENFDGSLTEPSVLPSRFPNLLVNGSSGIAVGMATNIPPHNLAETIDALVYLIDNPDADVYDLMKFIRGPDFPTGGIINGMAGAIAAYETGRGKVRIRARAEIVEKDGRESIIVSEIPYQVNKASLIESIADLVKKGRIEGISDLRDESDRKGMCIVIEVKRDASATVVLNQLYKNTQMEATFGIINLALVDNQPRLMSLKEMMTHYLDHRREVIVRRTKYELAQARKRHHILQGLIRVIDSLDEAIEMIRASESPDEARNALMSRLDLSEEQAKATLDMRLQKLTGLELDALREEYKQITLLIEDLEDILSSDSRVWDIIKEELLTVKEQHADPRRTEIDMNYADMEDEDLIPMERVAITITQDNYIKRINLDTYRKQQRGGTGLTGMTTKEEDQVTNLFVASTHDYILFFTNLGRVHWLKGYNIPAGGRLSRGKPIVNILSGLEPGEKVVATLCVSDFSEDLFLLFATRRGIIKKTPLSAYANVRSKGIKAIRMDEGDELVETRLSDGLQNVVLATAKGQAVLFPESDVRATGRDTRGVRGIKLRKGDEVVGMAVVGTDDLLLTVTEKGYGKITPISEYRCTRRGGKGVITIKTGGRNGDVVAVRKVDPGDELIIISRQGKVIRTPIEGISVVSRVAMGVRLMRLGEGDAVSALAHITPVESE